CAVRLLGDVAGLDRERLAHEVCLKFLVRQQGLLDAYGAAAASAAARISGIRSWRLHDPLARGEVLGVAARGGSREVSLRCRYRLDPQRLTGWTGDCARPDLSCRCRLLSE